MKSLTLALLLVSTSASAHAVGVSRGDYQAQGAVLKASLTFARGELGAALPASVDATGRMTPGSLEGARPELAKLLSAGLRASVAGLPCPSSGVTASLVEGDGVEVRTEAQCPAPGVIAIELPLLNALPVAHRHFARWTGATPGTAVLFRGTQHFTVAPDASASPAARGLWEQLAALLALAILARTVRRAAGLWAVFTLVETLSAALSRGWTLDSRWAHGALALTLTYAVLERLLAPEKDHPWMLSVVVGLIQGLGRPALGPLDWGIAIAALTLLTALVLHYGAAQSVPQTPRPASRMRQAPRHSAWV